MGDRPDAYPDGMVDPAEITDEQGEFLFKWRNQDGGQTDKTHPIALISSWIPDDDEYHGKTDISLNQARPIALLLEFEEIFPNIVGDGAYRSIMDSVDSYEQLLTSWDGKSREQQVEVLSSMNSALGGDDGGGIQIPLATNESED